MTEVLIIGASGLLGQHLLNEAEARHCSVTGTYFSEEVEGLERLDLGDFDSIGTMIDSRRPDVVMLAAAFTSRFANYDAFALAHRINAEAPREVAKKCKAIGAKLIHFSLSLSIEGESRHRRESESFDDDAFERTRAEGERNVLAESPSSLVIRTGILFGWNRLRSRENIVTGLIHRTRCGESIALRVDRSLVLSYAPEVARFTMSLMEHGASGLYEIYCEKGISEYDLGRMVCESFGLPEGLLTRMGVDEEPKQRMPDCLTMFDRSQALRFHAMRIGDLRGCLATMRTGY